MEKSVNKKAVVGILATSFFCYYYCISQVLLANIAMSYPDVSQNLVTMIMTIPTLISVPASFIIAPLTSKYDKKLLLLIGMVLYLAGGTLALFMGAKIFVVMLIFAAIAGIAYSLIMSVGNAALAEVVPSEHLPKYTAYNAATASLGCMVMFSMAGMLAGGGDWASAFWSTMLFIPLTAIAIVCMPSMKPRKAAQATGDEKSPSESPLEEDTRVDNKSLFVLILVSYFMFRISSAVGGVNLSSYIITEFGLGTAVETSMASNISSVCSLLTGFFLVGVLSKKLKKYLPWLGFILLLIFILLPTVSTSTLVPIYLAQAVYGVCSGVTIPAMISSGLKAMPKSAGVASSLMTAFAGLASFSSPLVIGFINGLIGGGFLDKYRIAACMGAVGFVILIFATKNMKD